MNLTSSVLEELTLKVANSIYMFVGFSHNYIPECYIKGGIQMYIVISFKVAFVLCPPSSLYITTVVEDCNSFNVVFFKSDRSVA